MKRGLTLLYSSSVSEDYKPVIRTFSSTSVSIAPDMRTKSGRILRCKAAFITMENIVVVSAVVGTAATRVQYVLTVLHSVEM